MGGVPARLVAQQDRGSLRARKVGVAPAHERDYRREQITAGPGEAILVAVGVFRVEDAIEQAGIHELAQPKRERGSRDPQVACELPVAADAEERFANDHHRPALADEAQGSADRVRLQTVTEIRRVSDVLRAARHAAPAVASLGPSAARTLCPARSSAVAGTMPMWSAPAARYAARRVRMSRRASSM